MPQVFPPAYVTIVFRGGGVAHVPQSFLDQLMKAKQSAALLAMPLTSGPALIDTATVERILSFEDWRESETPRLAVSRKRICSFGTVHDDSEDCRCHRTEKMPLDTNAAVKMLTMAESYAALPEDGAERADHKHHDWLPSAIASGYVHRVAGAHGLPLSLPAPTHGND